MTDLEKVRLCAEALNNEYQGKKITLVPANKFCAEHYGYKNGPWGYAFNPYLEDAQAMALEKQFKLCISSSSTEGWKVFPRDMRFYVWNQDLNAAIVDCVATMQRSKG